MTEQKTTALAKPTQPEAPAHRGMLMPVVSPDEFIRGHTAAADIIRKALDDGRDYGVIPGTSGKKVLLKPGAERLCLAFGLRPRFSLLVEQADHDREVHYVDKYRKQQTSRGFYRYVIRCELLREDVVVGEGIGSCSTMEQKYVSRPRDCENTALKMGKKRALVDAVLSALGLSDRFSQDVDDSDEDADDYHDAPSPPPRPAKPLDPKEEQAKLFDAISAQFIALKLDEDDDARAKLITSIVGEPKPRTLEKLRTLTKALDGLIADNQRGDVSIDDVEAAAKGGA